MKFLHSSDIMLPGYFGIHTFQFLVVMRYVDIKYCKNGGMPVWETFWKKIHGRKMDAVEEQSIKNDFINFMDVIEKNGFNPEMSVIEFAEQPILWMFDGSHRLGYELTRASNVFMPIKFVTNAPWGITNGPIYLRSIGVPENMLNELLLAYYEIYYKMRRTITGIVDANIFVENKEKIFNEAIEFGKMFIIDSKNIALPQGNNPWHDEFVLKNKNAVQITVKLERNTLYMKDEYIRSYEVDRFSKHFDELFGKNWGYLAHTITESIKFEEYLCSTFTDKCGRKN